MINLSTCVQFKWLEKVKQAFQSNKANLKSKLYFLYIKSKEITAPGDGPAFTPSLLT